MSKFDEKRAREEFEERVKEVDTLNRIISEISVDLQCLPLEHVLAKIVMKKYD